jgi:hypothetical protein
LTEGVQTPEANPPAPLPTKMPPSPKTPPPGR